MASVNAWIKALFGSDGIDDETVMTTSTQGLARYTSTLVQQAVVAASMGQIDLDTLHSGLSYYAQPLLSWCLGGVVGWLCAEIERQGVLSGMHLKVLQGLVLDSAFPESLLRANARELSRLLDPAAGLQSVMQSSGFDHVAVRARLDAARGADGPPAPPVPALLRAELHAVYMNMAAPGWEARILDSLASTLRADGATRTLEDVLADMLYPDLLTMERAGVPNAPYTLAQLVALLAALPLNIPGTPLAPAVVDAYLPALFNPRSPFAPTSAVQPAIRAGIMLAPPAPPAPAPVLPLAAHTLHRLLRATLLAVEAGGGDEDPEDAGSGAREGQVDADGDESMEGGGSTRAARRVDVDADALASHLADELRFQTSRPDATAAKRAKRSTRGLGPGAVPDLGLSSDQRALVDELIKAIEGDDELRTRWPVLAPPQKEKE